MLRCFLIVVSFLIFNFSTFAADSLESLVRQVAAQKLNLFGAQLLEPEQAFKFSASVKNASTLSVNWEIASEYYLYREKIKLELLGTNATKLGDYFVPNGFPKVDEVFGKVEIFTQVLNFDVPLLREDHGKQTVKLRAYFQGCAERGVCYAPMTKEVLLDLPIAHEVESLPENNAKKTSVMNFEFIVMLIALFVLILSVIIFKQMKEAS